MELFGDINAKKRRGPGRPFRCGNPGGPGRPPRDLCVPEILRELGAEEDPVTKRTRLQILMKAVYNHAMKGEAWAVNFILDRTEGKVTNALALQTTSGGMNMEAIRESLRKSCEPI